MIKKILIFLILNLLLSFNLFALEVDVGILKNTYNSEFDESQIIKELCERYFEKKYIFTQEEKDYFSKKDKLKELRQAKKNIKDAYTNQNLDELKSAKNKLKTIETKTYQVPLFSELNINFRIYDSNSDFTPETFFLKSKIALEKVTSENNFDYMIIPSSIELDNNLVRVRLIVYSACSGEFSLIYDDVKPLLKAREMIEDNIVKLFPFFLTSDRGIISLPYKGYGYTAYIDDVKCIDGNSVTSGKRKLKVLAEGYAVYEDDIDIKPLEVNNIDFELKKIQHSDLLISTNGLMYDAFSSEIGVFSLPYYFENYSTPSSISFSHPGFETRYIALTGDVRKIDISLKPDFLSNKEFLDVQTRKFYSSLLLTISAFAFDITSRSFLNQYPDSRFLQISQYAFSSVAYFSLGLVFYGMIDYFFSSLYAFK